MIRLQVGGDLQGTEVLIAEDGVEYVIANPRGGSHIVMRTGQKFIVAESLDELIALGVRVDSVRCCASGPAVNGHCSNCGY